jgi:hypothetical protein
VTPENERGGEQAPHEHEFQAQRERDEGVAPEEGEEPRDEDVVERETEAAASDAARIGGDPGEEPGDEAERPVLEGGGGEAEGFEQAEADLIEEAEHGDRHDPAADEYTVEDDARHQTAEYGEPDEVHPSEVEDSDR